MNLKTLFLASVIWIGLLPASRGQAYQPFPADTARWEVERCWFLFPGGWYDHYVIAMDGSDTMYTGQVYKKLTITVHQKHGPTFDSLYQPVFFGGFRESNKQVFMFQSWASVDTTEHLVYDFSNTSLGDTIFTSCLASPPGFMLGHVVVAVDSVLVGTQYRNRMLLHDPNNSLNAEYWIEGVGSSLGFPFASFWSITDNSYDLTCFYTGDSLRYVNPAPVFGFCTPPLPPISCDSLLTGLPGAEPEESMIQLYPNPAGDQLSVSFPETGKHIAGLYDAFGRLILHKSLEPGENTIDVSKLATGIYVIRIRSPEQQYIRKVLIRH